MQKKQAISRKKQMLSLLSATQNAPAFLDVTRIHKRFACFGRMTKPMAVTAVIACAVIAACGTQPVARIDGHLVNEPRDPAKINTSTSTTPQPVRQVPLPPPPQPRIEEVKYSITVKDVPVQELLFAISRDTNINIDVHPNTRGLVTLNAINQTVWQILERLEKQLDIRVERNGPNIAVVPDSPVLRLYQVDYVNIARDSSGTISVQTQVVGPQGVGATSGTSSGGQNSTLLKIENSSKNKFWESLELNIKDILKESDKFIPKSQRLDGNLAQASQGTQSSVSASGAGVAGGAINNQGAGALGAGNQNLDARATAAQIQQNEAAITLQDFQPAASVIINKETGTISIRATGKQHEKISEFINKVSGSAKRQVLIEATVVEVTLNDDYQSGVDWAALGAAAGAEGLGFTQSFLAQNLAAAPFFNIKYLNSNGPGGKPISGNIKLLESFGSTKVLSSPRITTLNNQTAVMKVVENKVYFTVSAVPGQPTQTTTGVVLPAQNTYTSTPNVVPEGFVMNVTPQISEGDIITLNVRPSITRIVSFVQDPNPDLARANVINNVPQIQTREFETVLRIPSGQTAVLGGLMQDSFSASRDGLPIISRWKIFGDVVSYRKDQGKKTELVIFLRPIVIKDASVDTDFAAYRRLLPDGQFFKEAEPLFPALYPKVEPPSRSASPTRPVP